IALARARGLRAVPDPLRRVVPGGVRGALRRRGRRLVRPRHRPRADDSAAGAERLTGGVTSEVEGLALTDHHINVFHSDEDRGYIADIPDLDACSAFGPTAAEALAEVEKAKEAWLTAARAAGKPMPEPRYRPAIYAR